MNETTHPTAERLNWRVLINAAPDTPPADIDALSAYFAPFAAVPMVVSEDGVEKPSPDHPCLNCGKPLLGLTTFMLGGGFTWGLTHGEGHCLACGWPARAHHFIKDAAGADLITIRNVILQYHPDEVSAPKKRRA